MPTSKQFQDAETLLDEYILGRIQGKTVRQLHALLAVTAYLGSIDVERRRPKPEDERTSYSSRFGYLAPLLSSAAWSNHVESVDSALWAFGEPPDQVALVNDLVAYSQFCELAPYVYRNGFVASAQGRVLRLDHPSSEYRAFEERDIALSNVALPFSVSTPIADVAWFDRQVQNLPNVDSGYRRMLHTMAEWYAKHCYEAVPLSTGAMQACLGVTLGEFRWFVAACMALGQFHISMADAIMRKCFTDEEYGDDSTAGTESREWMAPCLKRTWLVDHLVMTGQLAKPQVEKLLELYVVSGNSAWGRGDGFAPPFVQFGEHIAFSPLAIRHSMSFRNALVTLHQRDPTSFDEIYSQHLEPRLIELASQLFSKYSEYDLKPNFVWSGGELDLIVYDESNNTALIIEVKGAVMPEGARMVQRVEGRLLEGIAQIRRFEELSGSEKDLLLSRALGKKRSKVCVRYGLLAWAGFGTEAIWSKMENIAPLNLPLLTHLLGKVPAAMLRDFPSAAHAQIDYVVNLVAPLWTMEEVPCGPVNFIYPKMSFDTFKANQYSRDYFVALR